MDKYYLNGVPTQVNLMKMMLKCIQGRDKAIVVRSKGYKEKADGFSNDTYGYAPWPVI